MEIAILVFLGAIALVGFSQMAVVVPEREVYRVERLGKFQRLLRPGLHFVLPFIERVAYRHSQKEAERGSALRNVYRGNASAVRSTGAGPGAKEG